MSGKNSGTVEGILPTGDPYAVLVQYVTGDGAHRTGLFSVGAGAEVTCDGTPLTDYSVLAQWIARHPSVEVTLNPDPNFYGLSRKTQFKCLSVPYYSPPPKSYGTTRQEVIADVTAFVQRKYGGDWKKAFDAEDEDGDGRLSTGEVSTILAKSGVGVRLTRWAIALQVVEAMDADGDGFVSFDEFNSLAHVS